MPKLKIDYKIHFLNHVDKVDGKCWEWNGCRNAGGYGYLRAHKTGWLAHRFMYHYFVAPIPDGMFVCHKCDNPPCCNPEHLFIGNNSDNIKDAFIKGRVTLKRMMGEGHPIHKLKSADIPKIRNLKASGMSDLEIAPLFGVSDSSIYKIVKGKMWTHIQ